MKNVFDDYLLCVLQRCSSTDKPGGKTGGKAAAAAKSRPPLLCPNNHLRIPTGLLRIYRSESQARPKRRRQERQRAAAAPPAAAVREL